MKTVGHLENFENFHENFHRKNFMIGELTALSTPLDLTIGPTHIIAKFMVP